MRVMGYDGFGLPTEEEIRLLRVDEPWRYDINHPRNKGHCLMCTEFRLNEQAPGLGNYWLRTCGAGIYGPCRYNHAHHVNDIDLA